MTMERKIGEIFEFGGEWYQTAECGSCECCAFQNTKCDDIRNVRGECVGSCRSDRRPIIFKKLEKVGEPYEYFIQGMGIIMVQEYIFANANYIWEYNQDVVVMDCQNGKVAIEVKQNKEDMEEYRMHDAKEDIPEFDKVVDECLFGEDKLNLKPFDLEAAKAGKPVCTRDGRKARIICFDAKGDPCPIIALVEENNIESAYRYDKNGQNAYKKSELDLMMLPEKKEGWVNVYKERCYETREEAIRHIAPGTKYVDTIRVEWEE